jgi:hypothetical protein
MPERIVHLKHDPRTRHALLFQHAGSFGMLYLHATQRSRDVPPSSRGGISRYAGGITPADGRCRHETTVDSGGTLRAIFAQM